MLVPRSGECQELPLFLTFHIGLPEVKEESKRDELLKLHEAWLSHPEGFSCRAF